ncbi:CopD family protein [Halomicrococcus sp. NG-SE-24]|uniref:CopD family protein n=1 Tax=Halomicrococcus sp. NG-SE-24 TaxID=3436928 RepID=UPI003D99B9F2
MTVLDATMELLHTLFAGVWAGWTLFVAALVVPAARNGRLGAEALDWLTGRYAQFSTLAAVVLFATGGHLAGTRYEVESLTGTGRGHLVLAMVALWFALAGLSHVGRSRLSDALDRESASDAAAGVASIFYAAGVVAVGLLLVAGLL